MSSPAEIGYRAGMSETFAELVPTFRTELLAHCYRMTGALSDAEDALQNAMVRAWKAFDSFEGRSSVRTWLYKITTNACLDLLAARRARTMPELVDALAGEDAASGDPAWLEPFPQPDAAYASREAVRLAFVVALQVLPPRQRATLILRDVVGLSAEETASALETSVAAVTSALQRARAELDEHPRARRAPITGALGELLGTYLRLFEAGDAAGLVALLSKDAVLSMPPAPMWARGPEAIAELLRTMVFPRGAPRMVACTANGAPAFGVYLDGKFAGLTVLDVDSGKIVAIQTFLSVDPAPYGLAPELAGETIELIPGAQLGRYHLEHVLGNGGMGQVWLAYDRDLERRVAIKVLRPELAGNESARARLVREARAMAKLRHPNVVTVFDVTVLAGHDVVVMELVDGADLARWAITPRSHAELLAVLIAAGRGLAAAHTAGLVHRDFKPDNVLVGDDGRVLVSDFGLARTFGDPGTSSSHAPLALGSSTVTQAIHPAARRRQSLSSSTEPKLVAQGTPPVERPSGGDAITAEGTVVGTPAYMAPEQLRGEEPDPRTDQFAFCLAAWELLAGLRPFDAGHLVELAAGFAVSPRQGDRLPAGVEPLLARGLAPDPHARWSAMDELLDALAAV